MPQKLAVTHTYTCTICNQEYSSLVEDEARARAEECEVKGTVLIHRFSPGMKLVANTEDPSGALIYRGRGTKIEIVGSFFERITHKPMYHIRFLSHVDGRVYQEHPYFPAENIWFLTVIHRQTTGITTKSGPVI